MRFRRLPALVVSSLARVEVPAALWRERRLGEISSDQTRLLVHEFEADYFGTDSEPPRFAAVAVLPVVLDAAARLCAVHATRACAAIQLS